MGVGSVQGTWLQHPASRRGTEPQCHQNINDELELCSVGNGLPKWDPLSSQSLRSFKCVNWSSNYGRGSRVIGNRAKKSVPTEGPDLSVKRYITHSWRIRCLVNVQFNDRTERTCSTSTMSLSYPGSELSVEQLVYALAQAFGPNSSSRRWAYLRCRVIPTQLFVQRIGVRTTQGLISGDPDVVASLIFL